MAFRRGAPVGGIYQGLSPALPAYNPAWAPSLLNLRVARGEWLCRKGQEADSIIPGVGRTRLLTTFYDGSTRIRVGARGENDEVGLYYLRVGTDLTWGAVNDQDGNPVTDLASNVCHFLTVYGQGLLTDQETQLRSFYEDPNAAGTWLSDPVVNLPTPTGAPTVEKTWYGFFERWDGSPPYGWYESSADLDFHAPGSSEPDFELDEAGTTRLRSDTGARGEFVSKNSTYPQPPPLNFGAPTAALAMWIQQTIGDRTILQVQMGGQKKNQLQYDIKPPAKDTPYVFFMPMQGLTEIDYFRIKNTNPQTIVRNLFMSGIVMPGQLLGRKQYRFTYYRPSTEQESNASDAGPIDGPLEFTEGVNNNNSTSVAFQRCAAVIPIASPVRETGDRIRVYVRGGTAALETDGDGQPVWTFAGEIDDFDTLLNGAITAPDSTFDVDDATPFTPETTNGITTYQWGVIDPGEDAEEFFRVTDVTGNTITTADPLQNDHADNAVVQLIFLDNITNTELAAETRVLDLDRDDPPPGAKWIVASPDGRVLAFNFLEDRDGDDVFEYRRNLGMAVSNQPTPQRRRDYQIFPINPNPYTTNSPIQGFRTDLIIDDMGDEIMWAGIYNGLVTVLTRKKMLVVTGYSQANWYSGNVRKVLDRGCIASETVRQINGLLIFASDGPSILAWNGREVKDISNLKVSGEGNTYLGNAPAGYEADDDVLTVAQPNFYWDQWFAVAHAVGASIYYRLWMIPEDPLLARLTDLELLSATTVSSATYEFTEADLGRAIEIPETPSQLGWFPGLYLIESVAAGVATLDRAIGNFGGGYPYEVANAVVWEPFNNLRLDYDVLHDLWEPVQYYWDSNGDGLGDKALGWDTAEVRDGAGDQNTLYAAEFNPAEGDVWHQETGTLDGDVPIKVQSATSKVYLFEGGEGVLGEVLIRGIREAGECDTLLFEMTLGGSTYPEQTLCARLEYAIQKGTGDQEIKVPFNMDNRPRGRWAQLQISGDVRTRLNLREVTDEAKAVRDIHLGGRE